MLKRWLSILISVAFLLAASPVHAADVYTTYRLPEPTWVIAKDDGEEYAGYDLGQYKELLRMDNDLRLSVRDRDISQIILKHQKTNIESLNKAVDVLEENIVLVSDDRDRITKKWEADNKKRHKAEQKPFINVNGWLVGIAVVETVLIIVLIGMTSGG